MINPYSTLLAALVGLAAAIPAAYEAREEPCEPHTLCVDRINDCGVRFGGCYDICNSADAPVDPGCAGAATTTGATVPTYTYTTITITTLVPIESGRPTASYYTETVTVSVPIATERLTVSYYTETVTVTVPVAPSPETTATPTICVDYINACGETYGGCFASTSPFPTFTGPSCSLETAPTTTAHFPVTISTP